MNVTSSTAICIYVTPGSPATPALAYVALLQTVSSGIFWCRLCSGLIFRTINKYNVVTILSTDVASEWVDVC